MTEVALERLARLRRLHETAKASADGLQPRVEDARRVVELAQLDVTMITRATGEGVVVGDGGLAFTRKGRDRVTREPGSAAEYVLQVSEELVRSPRHDAATLAIHEAKARLAEVINQRREVLERAAELRRGVEAVEAALRSRGWREALPSGEGLLRDARGPVVVTAIAEPRPNLFQAAHGGRR
jgi:hypothetical protein